MVVDDEASIREAAQAVLESYGYSVLSAADGSEAVALYAQHGKEIQVVITDMAMPVMDGWISHHPGPAEDGPLG